MAKVRFKPTKRTTCSLIGGPYDGHKLHLAHPESGTMCFSANGVTGRYVQGRYQGQMEWEAI